MRLDEAFRLIYKEIDNDDTHEIRNVNIIGYSVNGGEVHFMSLLIENNGDKYKVVVKTLYEGELEDDYYSCEVVNRDGLGRKLI